MPRKIYIRLDKGEEPKHYLDFAGYYRDSETKQLIHREIYKVSQGLIPKGWIVHHIDCVKTNNELNNLIALPEGFHNLIHSQMKVRGYIMQRGEIIKLLAEYAIEAKSAKRELSKVRSELKKLRKREKRFKQRAEALEGLEILGFVKKSTTP